MVRPRRGSQSAGLIIWFERSGGRGFDKETSFESPAPGTSPESRIEFRGVLASTENVDAAILSTYIRNVAHL